MIGFQRTSLRELAERTAGQWRRVAAHAGGARPAA
jgi:hypothetical protein